LDVSWGLKMSYFNGTLLSRPATSRRIFSRCYFSIASFVRKVVLIDYLHYTLLLPPGPLVWRQISSADQISS